MSPIVGRPLVYDCEGSTKTLTANGQNFRISGFTLYIATLFEMLAGFYPYGGY